MLHRVVHCHRGCHLTSGGVHVERDVLLWVLLLQKEELGNDGVCDIIIDGGPEEDDAFLKQA